MFTGAMWSGIGSIVATLMFIWAMFKEYFPHHIRDYIQKYIYRLRRFIYPYIQITFHEYNVEGFKRSEVYTAIEAYLNDKSSERARRLKADIAKDSQSFLFCMDDLEEVTDEFEGAKLSWASGKTEPKGYFYATITAEKWYYQLTYHKRHSELVTKFYLTHVFEKGKEIRVIGRQRKLYTNNPSTNWYGSYKNSVWSHVVFEHPATFKTLAIDPAKKKEIEDDLISFTKAKNRYKIVGKPWKRGYLLYGAPGTGKSTMIAAMANLLGYDVYDLELTAVKNNTELRKLMIETSSKSIIVIEDIDCSLDLTGQRKKKKKKEEEDKEKDPILKKTKEECDKDESNVTLSGLLNCIDGLWSACGGERIVVFTTNHIEKLDTALIRKGRMDKHIELSYCSFEAFKVLAHNYLDLESHQLFDTIEPLMKEVQMTPADVAENLMSKTEEAIPDDIAKNLIPKISTEDAEFCLKNLIAALELAKEEARLKAEGETREKVKEESSTTMTSH